MSVFVIRYGKRVQCHSLIGIEVGAAPVLISPGSADFSVIHPGDPPVPSRRPFGLLITGSFSCLFALPRGFQLRRLGLKLFALRRVVYRLQKAYTRRDLFY